MAIQWGLLANLAKTYGDNYDSGRKAGIEDAKVSALADLASRYQDGNIPAGEIGRALLRSGDSSGALAAAQLDLANRRDERDFGFRKEEAQRSQQNSDRDFGFRQTEAERSQGNTERGYGLQERSVTNSERNADRTYDAGRTDAANTVRLREQELQVRDRDRRDAALRSGWQVGADGKSLVPVPGGPHDPAVIAKQSAAKKEGETPESVNPYIKRGSDKETTEAQAKDAAFANVMLRAEEYLRPREAMLANRVEFARGMGGNLTASDDYQLARTAQQAWARAKLRKESGAVIGEKEAADEIKTYFPQPGDSPERIEQKRILRKDATEGIIYGAGPNYQPRLRFDDKANLVPHVPKGQEPAKPDKFSVGAAFGDSAPTPADLPKPGAIIEKPADIPVGSVVRRNGQVFRQTENGLQYLGPSGGGSQ
jgi:hypothetical protein